MTAQLTIIGIGADGADGLNARVRALLEQASVVIGSPRQLESLGDLVSSDRHRELPSPLVDGLPPLLADLDEDAVLLASGDPTVHGIASTIGRIAPDLKLKIEPHPSSVSLACARLGWTQHDVTVVSLVSQPAAALLAAVTPDARIVVLAKDGSTVGQVCEQLLNQGWGRSTITVCELLGAAEERVYEIELDPTATSANLAVLAIECHESAEGARARTTVPGLDDDAFVTDGALTRQEIRALALAMLEPAIGHLLWDVGAGSGSVAIEWLRAVPGSRAIAIEPRADRLANIRANIERLGVPRLHVVEGEAPEALQGLARPDAIFIGGGVTGDGVIDLCWDALAVGGRLVASAVTLESEDVLREAMRELGGRMVRLEASHLRQLGSFTTWRPELPVSLWKVRKA